MVRACKRPLHTSMHKHRNMALVVKHIHGFAQEKDAYIENGLTHREQACSS